jgi:hypothetical protein
MVAQKDKRRLGSLFVNGTLFFLVLMPGPFQPWASLSPPSVIGMLLPHTLVECVST